MRIRTHTNPFNITDRLSPIDWRTAFTDYKEDIDLEIGFGRGVFLRHYAKQNPDRCIVGVDVRKQIVSVLDERLKKEDITNAHLIHSRGEICLEDCFEDQSLSRVFIFHPDPWFKKKHHKRRVVNPDFLTLLSKKMKPNATLFLSTDVTVLWEEMEDVCAEHSSFKKIEDGPFWKQDYVTHWHEFSQEDQRQFHYGTYEIIPS